MRIIWLALALLALSGAAASACVPSMPRYATPLDHFEMAQHIFTARLADVERTPLGGQWEERRFRFEVARVFRGEPPAEFELLVEGSRLDNCGKFHASPDKIYVFLPPNEDPTEGYYGYASGQVKEFATHDEAEAWIERHFALLERFSTEPPLDLTAVAGEAPFTTRLAEPSDLATLIDWMDEAYRGGGPSHSCMRHPPIHPGQWFTFTSYLGLHDLIDWDAIPYRPGTKVEATKRVAWPVLARGGCQVRTSTYLVPGTYAVRATFFTGHFSAPDEYLFRRTATVTVLPPSGDGQ